jgi:hypothetical protein
MSRSLQVARDSIGSEPNEFPVPVTIFKQLDIFGTLKLTDRNVSNSAIYGNVNTTYGVSKYTNVTQGGFILGHPIYGILGTSPLGVGETVDVLVSVINWKNAFVELFDTQDFIDTTNTTATWIEPSAGTTGSYDLTTGEIVQSEIIAKRPTAFTSATITVEYTGDEPEIYLSNGVEPI